MRTTLDLDEDVLLASKDLARRQKRTAGEVISELARAGLQMRGQAARKRASAKFGFEPIPKRGGAVVTNELINRLRDELGE
ncbi:MAG: antitoxin [Xanthomonadales bacterium]|nr:antitoxin [Xanthomonadales bacterium]